MSSYDLPPLIYTRGRTCSVLSRELTASEEMGNFHTLYLLDVIVGCFASLYTDYHYATYHLIFLWSFTPRYIHFGAGGSLPTIHAIGISEKVFISLSLSIYIISQNFQKVKILF